MSKSKRIALLNDARRSGKGLIVTRGGRPLARIELIFKEPGKRKPGIFRGRTTIAGDIIHTGTAVDWEMLR